MGPVTYDLVSSCWTRDPNRLRSPSCVPTDCFLLAERRLLALTRSIRMKWRGSSADDNPAGLKQSAHFLSNAVCKRAAR